MGFLNKIIKKSIEKKVNQRDELSSEQTVDQILRSTRNQIERGLERPIASTGTPIKKLHGAAKTTATLSNIGGGSKESGGGGMESGMNVITKYAQVKTAKNVIEQTKSKRLVDSMRKD